MPDSESLRDEVIVYFETRFGVPPSFFSVFSFEERKGEIWATTAPCSSDLSTLRPSCLRIMRRMPHAFKPTSLFLRVLNTRITASRIEIERLDLLRHLLLGQTSDISLTDGFVAISFRGDLLGCGVVKNGRLRALIPVQKRKELLDCLEPSSRP